MTRRVQSLLLAGCLVIAVLELPAALRSVGEGWQGPYGAPGGYEAGRVAGSVPAAPVRARTGDGPDAAGVADARPAVADETTTTLAHAGIR